MSESALIRERFATKVAAEFDSQDRAEGAVGRLIEEAAITQEQIELVRPHDPAPGSKVERDSSGIARTAIRSHLVLGSAGLIIGLVVAIVLILAGVDLAASSPGFALLAMGFLGAVLGLLLGGLVTARPDHDLVIVATRNAAEEGRWAVVAHAADDEQHQRIRAILDETSDRVTDSL